jgi:FAD/FMN-containing dehydrogenase
MWREHYDHVVSVSGRQPPLAPGHAFYANVETRGGDPDADAALFETVLGEAFEAGLLADAVLPKSAAEAEALWAPREIMDWANRRYPDFCVGDISLPIGEMDNYIAGLSKEMRARWPECELYAFGHLADGNIHVLAAPGGRDPERMEECYRLIYDPLPGFGGSIAAEHGIARQKVQYLHYARQPAEIELMRTLKRTLDPKSILNPGRVVIV